MKKIITIKTRPFQHLLLASDDLLNIAKPYYDQIQTGMKVCKSTGIITDLPPGVWQKEKSLSISAFMTKFAGLEALVNSCLNDFTKRTIEQLSDEFFTGQLVSLKEKLKKRKPQDWRLSTRIFLSIPICSTPIINPTSVFNIESKEWKEFEELVKIRHSYTHANSVNVKQVLTKVSTKVWNADDTNVDSFWQLTNTPKDLRIFNFESATKLCEIIDWVISLYKGALQSNLDDEYCSKETAHIEEGGKFSLGQPNLNKPIPKNDSIKKQGRNKLCA